MGTSSLFVVLLISSAASLEQICPSNILKKFLSDPQKAKEHYENGETVNVTCPADSDGDGYEYNNYDNSDGLDMKNIKVLTCNDGKWVGHYPECFSNCSKPDIDAILNPEYKMYAPGDHVTVMACKRTNASIEGDTTLICMADGTWIGSAICPKLHRSCNEQPPTISNAYITDVVLNEYTHGTVLRYKCSQAFDQMGKHSVTCNEGQWIPDSANLIQCIIGHCSHIYSRELDNMRVKNISGQVGTYAEFECYDGYELEGSAKILCMADRKWYPEIPKCKPISCPPPKQILNGRFIQEAYDGLLNIYQSTTRYDCDKGYRIVGPRFRKCQSDRTWSGNDTQCEEIVCENPSPPDNGKVYLTDNSLKIGSQIEYTCDENHMMEPISSQFAICTVHGHWSSPQPGCIKICKVRPLTHGSIYDNFRRKITANSYVLDNTQLTFSCYQGYEMYASGYETRGWLKCVNGTLLPGSPECRPRRCFVVLTTDLEYFNGQEKVLGNYIQSGTEVIAQCSNRTELVRSSSYLETDQVSVRCILGTLEPGSLACQDKRCTFTITRFENGHFRHRERGIDAGAKIPSSSNITLKCSKGYELYNNSNSMYLKLVQTDIKCYQGSFTSEIPSCEPKRCFIAPTPNLDYFIGEEKVLETFIQSGIVMNARCSNKTELFRSSSYLEDEKVNVSCYLGTLEPGSLVCKDKRCKIIATIDNGQFIDRGLVVGTEEKILSDSKIQLKCSEGYEPYNKAKNMYLMLEQTYIRCYQGSFTSEFPSCVPKRCFIAPTTNPEYFIGEDKVLETFIQSGIVMNARCSNKTELFRSSSYLEEEQVNVTCYLGKLEPESLVCKDKRCNIFATIDNGQFRKRGIAVGTGEKIFSDSYIQLNCSEGYELYNKTNSTYLKLDLIDIKCYQGSFTSEIPSCEPKQCLLEPPVNMEYFTEENTELLKYIDNGTQIKARCFDRMELVLSSSYLDKETDMQCIMGTLEPRTLECKGKRCNITHIENGKLVNGESEIDPRAMIGSNSRITLVCSDGFELYNESNSMYLGSNKTDILCYQGSFNVAIPKCNPKRCRVDKSLFLLSEVSYVEHGQNWTVRCPDNMELHLEGNYQNLEETSLVCNKGIWTPTLPMCIKKSCKPLVLTEAVTGFVAIGNKSTSDNVFPHDQSIQAVCKNGYRQQGIFTCQEGSWTGNSTCVPEVCSEPEFQFLVVKNGTLENEHTIFSHGAKLNASCGSSNTLHADTDIGGNGTLTECIHGEWKPKFSCKERCFIVPTTDLEYFIGQEKILENYIQSGTEMNARCSNKTELFLSSSYLETEQVDVRCTFGKLEPGSLVCQDKRCTIIITIIRNGHFRHSGRWIVAGEKIQSGSKIQLNCSDGYELYNKTNSMYLNSDQTDIECYQGSFTTEIPSCEPKRCFIVPTTDLDYFIGQEKVLENYIQSGTEMNARCSNKTELFLSSSYIEREQVDVKCILGTLKPGSPLCQDKRCTIVITRIRYGRFSHKGRSIFPGEKIPSGSNIQLNCSDGYELYNKTNSTYLNSDHTNIECYQGSFTTEIPSCEPKRCFIVPTTDLDYFIRQEKVLENYIQSGTDINARCSNKTELFLSSSYIEREQVDVKCILGTLKPGSPLCHDKRCTITIARVKNGHFRHRGTWIAQGEKIPSGSNRQFKCYDGYEIYNKTNSMYTKLEQTDIECYQGSFTTEIPSCEPKQCLIKPSSNLEYFIGQTKVLENYVDNGIMMRVRCSNRTELFRSSSYLESDQVSLKCNFGRLEPESPVCKDKRCNITNTAIVNGQLIHIGKVLVTRVKILSGSNITLKCFDGYELYNKTISVFLDLEETDIKCHQGSFTSEIPSCEPKRCRVDQSLFLLPKVQYIQHGQNWTVRCPDNMELHLEGNYKNLEEASMLCKKGIWTPTLPMCIKKRCKPPVLTEAVTSFVAIETNSTPENYFPHNQSVEVVCKEGYRPQGTFTCQEGIWTGNSTCEHETCKTIDVGRDITGFVVRDTKTKLGDFLPHSQSIEAVCDEGYRPHGIITCNAGKWLGNSTCETDVTRCVLKDPGMQIISLGNREFLKVGENANVSCKFGYQYVPNIFIKDASYEYDYGESKSTADPSEIPETEDNENLLTVSDGNYTCIENGKWEPELRFSCKQIVCDSFDVENLENGKIIYLPHYDYTVGTVASFHCDPGYTRHGPENRTCQIDGTWSGPCVTCQKNTHNSSVACLAPCVPLGARKTGSHPYEIGSIVKFHCLPSKMQDRESRSSSMNCTKNGDYASWKGNTIDCKEIICEKGDHYGFENGRVHYSSSVTTVGTEASFICNSGYYRIGPKSRTCQKDGTWSRGCVKCQKHQDNSDNCPVPCIPDGAKRIGSISYKIGSRIQLYCLKSNMNYTVERTCVKDGNVASWKGNNINCKAKCGQLTETYKVVHTGVVPGILSDKTVVELNCSGSLAPVQAECRKDHWHPHKPTCKYPCSLIPVKGTLYSYFVTKDLVSQGPIVSGRQIKVTCEDGFLPNNQTYNVSKCENGVWTPEIVKCEKTGNVCCR
ncbi:hypothetical protein ACJMK2_038606 [Sinanodonta woodiana]|uniref:Sushi domain-containing protein n=1 Tax=Sinanodonta woodiana TaxID=1069815 RepID=A0ABD3W9J0_SINWO